MLYDMTREEIATQLAEWGQPAYRAQQVFEWVSRGASIDEMSNLPKKLRTRLAELGEGGVEIELAQQSADGSEKYLFRCADGNAVEGVLMHYEHGNSLCISTQAGCRMGCVFCASGANGLQRNLTTGELLGQLYAVNKRHGGRAFSHCVLMGCGEPLDNYDNVVKFLRIASDEKGMNMSLRNMSLSTCGLVEQIDRLAQEQMPVTLCISLHAPDDATRRKLLPIANKYAIEEVVAAAKRYEVATGRRVVFEYTLVAGVNDAPRQARQLAQLTKGMRKHINLIPANSTSGEYKAPDDKRVQLFYQTLRDEGASVTLRRTLGADVEGACGQLRARYE